MNEIDFDPNTMTRATAADIARIYRQLWGVELEMKEDAMYPTTGYAPSISRKEADANELATLQAMVEAYPTNEYWINRLADFKSQIETKHDIAWLDSLNPAQIDFVALVTSDDDDLADLRQTEHDAAM